MGERGDILSQSLEHKKSKCTNLDEAMHNMTITDRPLKIAEALEKYKEEPEPIRKVRKHSQSSSYENLSEVKKPTVTKVAKTKTLSVRDKVVNNNYEASSKTLEAPRNKWECKACTYLNDAAKDICEMCSKSRGNVEQQMEIGGPQCSKCTLVNCKDAKVCQACGASLEHSPTYI